MNHFFEGLKNQGVDEAYLNILRNFYSEATSVLLIISVTPLCVTDIIRSIRDSKHRWAGTRGKET